MDDGFEFKDGKSKSLNIALTCHICKNCDDLFFLLYPRKFSAAMKMINNENNFCSRSNSYVWIQRISNKLVFNIMACNN